MSGRNCALTRRGFVLAVAGCSVSAAVQGASETGTGRPVPASGAFGPVCIFSKHLQWLDYDRMAETAASLGFDGIDLTVRPGGHVLPENADRDLPRAIKAAQRAGLKVPMITTAINDPSDPDLSRMLETASESGVGVYRMGYFHFEDDKPVEVTLEDAKRNLSLLAEINARYRLRGDYQNHAGRNYLGASLWDLWHITRDLPGEWVGCQFDLRHAVVVAPENWLLSFRAVASRIHSAAVKDFRWQVEGGRPVVDNCPLGEGAAPYAEWLPHLRESSFSGPMSLHLEYPLGGANDGAATISLPAEQVTAAMKRDLDRLRALLERAR